MRKTSCTYVWKVFFQSRYKLLAARKNKRRKWRRRKILFVKQWFIGFAVNTFSYPSSFLIACCAWYKEIDQHQALWWIFVEENSKITTNNRKDFFISIELFGDWSIACLAHTRKLRFLFRSFMNCLFNETLNSGESIKVWRLMSVRHVSLQSPLSYHNETLIYIQNWLWCIYCT